MSDDRAGWSVAEKWLAAALAICALVICVIGIDRPLFIDEAFSVIASSQSLSGLMALLRHDSNEPLYFVLLHGWMAVFGTSEIAARIPSVFFYLLGIVGVFLLGREVTGSPRTGLIAAAFYGGSLQAVHLAQKIRPYSLLGAAAAFSTFYLFRCFWRRDREMGAGDYALFMVATLVGCFTHVWFVFLMFGQLVAYALFFPKARWVKLLAGLVLPGVAFLLAWGGVLLQQAQTGAVDWLPRTDAWTLPGAILEFYGGKQIGAAVLVALAAASALAVALKARQETIMSASAVVGTQPRRRDGTRGNDTKALWALLVIFAVTLAVPIAVSLFKPLYWPGRHTLIALPALAAALALWLGSQVPRPVMVGLAAALLALAVGMDAATRREVIENSEAVLPYADSDQAAAQVLGSAIGPGDVILFTGLSRASIQYYLDRSGQDRGVELVSFPAENGEHLGWDNDRIGRAALDSEAVALSRRLAAEKKPSSGMPARLWIVAGMNAQANSALLDALEAQHFEQQGLLRVRGAFFTVVAVYQ